MFMVLSRSLASKCCKDAYILIVHSNYNTDNATEMDFWYPAQMNCCVRPWRRYNQARSFWWKNISLPTKWRQKLTIMYLRHTCLLITLHMSEFSKLQHLCWARRRNCKFTWGSLKYPLTRILFLFFLWIWFVNPNLCKKYILGRLLFDENCPPYQHWVFFLWIIVYLIVNNIVADLMQEALEAAFKGLDVLGVSFPETEEGHEKAFMEGIKKFQPL